MGVRRYRASDRLQGIEPGANPLVPIPRVGWVKPDTDQRLSDYISIGVLNLVFPHELVGWVVAEPGRTGRRPALFAQALI